MIGKCFSLLLINKTGTRIFAKKKIAWNRLKYHHLSLNFWDTLYIFVRLFDQSKKFIDILFAYRSDYITNIYHLKYYISSEIVFRIFDVCITSFHIRRITFIKDFESGRVWFTDLFIIEVTSFLWLIVSCLVSGI